MDTWSQGHAEETLNTLHFASMALRVRSKPVLLLDPQDQLVVDLKHTIKQLRTENQVRQLGPHTPTASSVLILLLAPPWLSKKPPTAHPLRLGRVLLDGRRSASDAAAAWWGSSENTYTGLT